MKKRRRRDEGGDLVEELDELQGAWDESEPQEGFEDVPEGTYQVKIAKARLNKSKSSGRLQVSFEFVVVSGKQKNRKVFSHMGIETTENMDWFKGALEKLGAKIPKKLKLLPEILEELLDKTCEIKVKQKGDFTNVYIQKATEVDDEEVEDADEDDDSEMESEREKKRKKSKRKDDDDDDEEEEEEEEEEETEDDEDDEDEKPAKKKKKPADDEDEEEEDEDSDDDDDEDEDDEEDEKPAKKKSKKSKEDDEF